VTSAKAEEGRSTIVDAVEDEDDLLYGEAAPSLFTEAAAALTEPVKVGCYISSQKPLFL